jgi:hypothetical protein
MNIDVDNLVTIKNWALGLAITTSYVYKLIKQKKLQPVTIDGIKFINKAKYPTIPS